MSAVGIVLVSHSRMLAEGAAELARQMGVGAVVVEAAGGDADGGLGTSFGLVERAAEAADSGSGVVLIADLGSSVLTAKTLVDEGAGIVLADAPFVEGAVAAASAAAGGADLAAVVAAAGDAYNFRKT